MIIYVGSNAAEIILIFPYHERQFTYFDLELPGVTTVCTTEARLINAFC